MHTQLMVAAYGGWVLFVLGVGCMNACELCKNCMFTHWSGEGVR